MKIKIMTTAVALACVALSGCETTYEPGTGPGPGTGGTPPPIQKAALPGSIPTADGDSISVYGSGGGANGPVTLCLTTRSGMWKKEIRVSGGPTLYSEGGTTDCRQVGSGFTRFEIVKAKALGAMTGVGYGSIDLSGWGGGRVTISWNAD